MSGTKPKNKVNTVVIFSFAVLILSLPITIPDCADRNTHYIRGQKNIRFEFSQMCGILYHLIIPHYDPDDKALRLPEADREEYTMNFAKEKIFAVIMAGGKGERLWPLSTEERPKPLLSLNGQQTLLEETVQRLFPLLDAENILVITDEKSAVQAREILSIPPENVIAEPCRRNTAPCIALATALIKQRCEDAVMIVLPADHKITPVKRFQEDLLDCIKESANGNLAVLGIVPDNPATG